MTRAVLIQTMLNLLPIVATAPVDVHDVPQPPNDDSITSLESGDLVFTLNRGVRHRVPQYKAEDFLSIDGAPAVTCDGEEKRCFVPEHQRDLCPIVTCRACNESPVMMASTLGGDGSFHYKDDRQNLHVLSWSLVRLLPREAYRIVFYRGRDMTPRFGVFADPVLKHADSWLDLRTSLTSEYKKHTRDKRLAADDIHLVMYPMAWRFFRLRMHVPLHGVALAPPERTSEVEPAVHEALVSKLEDVAWCAGGARPARAWCSIRDSYAVRFWARPPGARAARAAAARGRRGAAPPRRGTLYDMCRVRKAKGEM